MSNPGVITLLNLSFNDEYGIHSFRVEDNIGEAIHFHLDNFRIDLTVKEFRNFADDMLDAINAVADVKGFDARKCDPLFLFEIAELLPYLQAVQIEYMPVKELIVDTNEKDDGKDIYRYIKHSRVVKALQGDFAENDRRKQNNLIGQTNLQRLHSIFESVRKNGYPFNDEYIILFNDQNIIRDGQHRAASIYVLAPDAVIAIQRWIFRDNMFSIPNPTFDLS